MKKFLINGLCSVAVVVGVVIGLPERQKLRISDEGILMTAELEGCRREPYLCSANVWTSGLGHTTTVNAGVVLTDTEIAINFITDIKDAEQAVNRCIKTELTQGQFDAFTSFAFNVGEVQFCNSTLVKKANLYNRHGACYELSKWIYVGKKKINGLIKRREVELARCLQ